MTTETQPQFTMEIMDVEGVIRQEIAAGCTQKQIAQTYALGIRSTAPTNWQLVNEMIRARWSKSGLLRVKNLAWSGNCFPEQVDQNRKLERWRDHLLHMTGSKSRIKQEWGFRNHFCAEIGSRDHGDFLEMAVAGLVTFGRKLNDGRDQYFHATAGGCNFAGLSEAVTSRALGAVDAD